MQRSKSTSAIPSTSTANLTKTKSFADVTAHRRKAALRVAAKAEGEQGIPSPVYTPSRAVRPDPFGASGFFPAGGYSWRAEDEDDGAWWRPDEDEEDGAMDVEAIAHHEAHHPLFGVPEEDETEVAQAPAGVQIAHEDKLGVLSLHLDQLWNSGRSGAPPSADLDERLFSPYVADEPADYDALFNAMSGRRKASYPIALAPAEASPTSILFSPGEEKEGVEGGWLDGVKRIVGF